jgi:hypothetical protein
MFSRRASPVATTTWRPFAGKSNWDGRVPQAGGHWRTQAETLPVAAASSTLKRSDLGPPLDSNRGRLAHEGAEGRLAVVVVHRGALGRGEKQSGCRTVRASGAHPRHGASGGAVRPGLGPNATIVLSPVVLAAARVRRSQALPNGRRSSTSYRGAAAGKVASVPIRQPSRPGMIAGCVAL